MYIPIGNQEKPGSTGEYSREGTKNVRLWGSQ